MCHDTPDFGTSLDNITHDSCQRSLSLFCSRTSSLLISHLASSHLAAFTTHYFTSCNLIAFRLRCTSSASSSFSLPPTFHLHSVSTLVSGLTPCRAPCSAPPLVPGHIGDEQYSSTTLTSFRTTSGYSVISLSLFSCAASCMSSIVVFCYPPPTPPIYFI